MDTWKGHEQQGEIVSQEEFKKKEKILTKIFRGKVLAQTLFPEKQESGSELTPQMLFGDLKRRII